MPCIYDINIRAIVAVISVVVTTSNSPLCCLCIPLIFSPLASLLVLLSTFDSCNTQIPKSLTKADGYDHREALFGNPPYGATIQQQVYYAASTLCESTVDTTGGYPQRSDNSPWKAPFILMVDRGDCTFVKKVRNAQRAGAAAVLIADDMCLCSHEACFGDDGQDNELICEDTEPIMADDGSGSDITIPSFLLFKEDADPIKQALMKNQNVRVSMSFSLPNPDSRVEYDMWTTPSDPLSRDILMSFKEAAVALGDEAFFTPHQYICTYEAFDHKCHCFVCSSYACRHFHDSEADVPFLYAATSPQMMEPRQDVWVVTDRISALVCVPTMAVIAPRTRMTIWTGEFLEPTLSRRVCDEFVFGNSTAKMGSAENGGIILTNSCFDARMRRNRNTLPANSAFRMPWHTRALIRNLLSCACPRVVAWNPTIPTRSWTTFWSTRLRPALS